MDDTQMQLRTLLSEAGSTHHVFEQTALKGAYDQDWPAWYADYLIAHGLRELVQKPITAEWLSRFLQQSNEERLESDPPPVWVDYTAQDLLSQLSALGH